jgi:hypothetical protein
MAARRRLEGLLRKAAWAPEGGKTKGIFWSPLRLGVLVVVVVGGVCHDETRE